MPAKLVGTTPTLLVRSKNGTEGAETRLLVRVPSDATEEFAIAPRPDVTLFGTDDVTDGIPLYAGDTFSDDLSQLQAWYMVSSGGAEKVAFEVAGATQLIAE